MVQIVQSQSHQKTQGQSPTLKRVRTPLYDSTSNVAFEPPELEYKHQSLGE
jgi:hypothetical protein